MIDFAYNPLDLPIDAHFFKEHYDSLLKLHSFYSQYRTCEMIPLFTPGGAIERDLIMKSNESLAWTPQARAVPSFIRFIEKDIFPLLEPLPRTFILKTKPYGEVLPHVDCSSRAQAIRQHKLRIVLSGERTGLYFLDKDHQPVFIDGQHDCYVLDGSQPHGMINRSDQYKLTLCFGSPWQGYGHSEYLDCLRRSQNNYPDSVIEKSGLLTADEFGCYQEAFEGTQVGDFKRQSVLNQVVGVQTPKNP
jgi:hypothetical protein